VIDEKPTPEIELGETVLRTLFDGVVSTGVDYWYLWLGMASVITVLGSLNAWTKRFEARRRRRCQHDSVMVWS
jgi:hypothetical protein